MLNDLFDHESVVAIKNIPIWSFGMEDRWTWNKFENEKFSMKSCYYLILEGDNSYGSVSLTRNIWKASTHERLKMHLWRIAFNPLPTRDKLSEFSLPLILPALFVILGQSQPCIVLLIATLLELFGLVVVGTLELIAGMFNLRLI